MPILFVLLALLFAPAFAAAAEPARALDQLDLRIWNTDQGLPHNSVLAVGQTRDGMLWIGTWGGLARFDGVEFRNYTRDNTPAIGDNGMLTVVPDQHGGLWVGTHRGGLLRIDDDGPVSVVAAGTTIGSHVLALLDAGDALWIGTEGAGLYARRDGKVERVSDPNLSAEDTISALSVDPRGGVLVGTRHGAFRIAARGVPSEPIALPESATEVAVSGITELGDGTLWIATSRGVFRRATADGAWKQLAYGAATSLSVGRRGQVWIGTPAQGVLRIEGDALQQLRTVHGLPDSRVRAVLEDRDGGVWLGTNGGLVGLQSLPFGGIGTLQGLSNDYVRAVLETDGGVWIATARGLNRYEDGRLKRLESIQPLIDTSLLALAEDATHTLWIGTYADGLVALRNGGIFVPQGLELPNPQVRAVLVARDGTLWIGSQGGLVHYDPRARRMLELPPHVPTASVMALHEDAPGRIWIGTSEGLARITGDKVEDFGPQQGFPGEAVFAFREDPPGEIWIGSDAGLVHHAQERFAVLGPAQGLPFYSVLGVERDAGGSFWLASGSGVLRLAGSDIEAALGGARKLSGRLFNRDDGMPSSQCNGGSAPATLKLRSGELWFATARGVALVDPLTVDDRTPAPPGVVINHITIDDRDVATNTTQDLGPGRHTVAVQFAAIALSRQGQVDNAYRVLGLDDHWEQIGSERSVRLTTIPPGDYVLEVAARYGRGALSPKPARFAFSVQPMLWQRPWFLVLVALLAALLVAAVFQRRTAGLRRRGVELTRLVAEQTQALAREMRVIAQRDQEKSELLAQLEVKSHELERLAREDGLTRLYNRRHFDERLDGMVGEAARNSGAAPAVLLFDLDHFKQINDTRSHHVGDLVLRRFAELLREEFSDGVTGRYGGEEFVVALPNHDRARARARAESMRARVEAEPWGALDAGLAVTVSAGIAASDSGGTPAQLIRTADDRLYEAKRGGRNRVV